LVKDNYYYDKNKTDAYLTSISHKSKEINVLHVRRGSLIRCYYIL